MDKRPIDLLVEEVEKLKAKSDEWDRRTMGGWTSGYSPDLYPLFDILERVKQEKTYLET